MEFSHVYARAGTRVTILEALPQVLSGQDADAVAKILEESARIGIDVKTGVEVEAITAAGAGFEVAYRQDGTEGRISAEHVINGAGRIANVDTLDLEAGGIRIEVEPCLRSVSNPAVWVCGDALVSSAQLSPVATYEGRLVARNIVRGTAEAPDYGAVPSCVYTVPALASVGLTEAAAEAEGLKFAVSVNDMDRLVLGQDLCRDRSLGQGAGRGRQRTHPRRADRRPQRRRADPSLRARHAARHHRGGDQERRLRLPDLLVRHQEPGLKQPAQRPSGGYSTVTKSMSGSSASASSDSIAAATLRQALRSW